MDSLANELPPTIDSLSAQVNLDQGNSYSLYQTANNFTLRIRPMRR